MMIVNDPRRTLAVCGAALVSALAAGNAEGALFVNEAFSYSDGALDTVSGGTWFNHSGTSAGTQQVNAGRVVIADNDATVLTGGQQSTRDYNRSLGTTISSGTVYSAFDLNASIADRPSSGTNAKYFMHYGVRTTPADGSTLETLTQIARVPLQVGTAAGTYNIGISSNGTATTYFPTALTTGVNYRIVTAYNTATGEARLWVNPASEASTSVADTATAVTTLNAIATRIDDGTDGDKYVDNLLVGDSFAAVVPEPASIGLLAPLGLLALRRRRRA